MSGIFKIGQLVSPSDLIGEDEHIILYNSSRNFEIDTKCCGSLEKNNTALVVELSYTDGCMVRIVSSNGTGWVEGAYLSIVKQSIS